MAKTDPFEKYPMRYDNWFERNKYAYESELRAIEKLLPKNGQGVEIGVGTGRFAAPLGIKLGVDPSKRMLEIAKRRGIRVIDAVAENLPFNDNTFDFVLMITTICFLDDIEAAFEEIYRVLRPGGSLIIGFIDKDSELGRQYQQHKDDSAFYKIANFYSVRDVTFYLKKAGFGNFSFIQTLYHELPEITEIEPLKEGYGEGSFIAIRAIKMGRKRV